MLVSILAAALAFPQPTSLPRPVSSLTWAAPLQQQTSPAMASNGSIRFVAWADARSSSRVAFGTRVAADGTPLDPLGIAIPGITWPDAVTWTGENFAVIGTTKSGRAAVFVGTDATVSTSRPIDVPREYSFAAVSSSGPDTRLLFVRYNSNTILDARIVGARGDLLVSIATPLSVPLAAPPIGSRFIGAGRHNDFAIFGPSATVRIDRDGHVLANRAVSWPFQYFFTENIAVAGNDSQGFVLLRQQALNYSDSTVLACQLDDNAAFTGKTAVMPLPWIWRWAQSRPEIAPAGDGYMVVNQGLYGDNSAHEYVTQLSFDLTAQTKEVPDAGVPLLLSVEGGSALVVTSKGAALYLQPLSESLAASGPVLLNLSPPIQLEVAVAATSNGYAVAWLEQATGRSFQTYVRRFSMTGEPLDTAPLEVDPPGDIPYVTSPVLTATADVYVVNGRRLQASTGQWIDGAEVPRVIAAASNGREALLAVMGSTGAALQQLSSMGGIPAPLVPLPTSASGPVAITEDSFFRVNLASDGTDYLVVWNRYNCCFDLSSPPSPVYALRVRADGTWIDASPMQLSPDGWKPSVAWVGGSYVVTWAGPGGVHATRVGTSGNALDGTGDGVVVEVPSRYEGLSASVVSLGRDAILLIHHKPSNADSFWVGVRFEPSDLTSAATAVRTTLASDYSAAAAWVGGRIVVAYSSNFGASTGYVWRAYVQHFGDPIPRRRAIAR